MAQGAGRGGEGCRLVGFRPEALRQLTRSNPPEDGVSSLSRTVVAAVIVGLLTSPFAVVADACTSFVMDTPDGPVFGANLDLFIPGDGLLLVNQRGIQKESYRTGTTGDRLRWVSEYGSVTLSLVGNEFAWAGVNEAGLVISSMELRSGEYPTPDERPALFDGNWSQYLLDTCGTVDDVVNTDTYVTLRDQGYTSHYLIADSNGDVAAVEFLDGRAAFHVGEELPVKAMANIRYERAAWANEHGGTRWWWSNPGESAERVAACEIRSANFDASRDTSAVDYAFGTLIYYVSAPHTKWNIVFDIAKREFWYRTDQSPGYKHVALDSFDFSCESPKLMLDVNAPLEGDVGSDFVSYDPVVNRRVFSTFCDRFGLEVSSEETADLLSFFDRFDCASSGAPARRN